MPTQSSGHGTHQFSSSGSAGVDRSADVAALKRLARWCRRYSPIVGLNGSNDLPDAAEPDALFLDVTGCAHLFGGEEALARQALRDMANLKLTARVAIADTIGAAWAVAFCAPATGSGAESQGDRRRCARAGEMRVPARRKAGDGESGRKMSQSPTCAANVVATGEQAMVLSRLPVEALRLPPKVVESLREFDLRTIGQLMQLPRETLRRGSAASFCCGSTRQWGMCRSRSCRNATTNRSSRAGGATSRSTPLGPSKQS
jgi:protein ImuB